MIATKQDLFKDARDKITIADAWSMLGLSGEPKPSCKSPFREEKSPSFSVHADGRAFKDHATGEGGDVVEFIRLAIGGDHRDVRQWLKERIGTGTAAKPSPITKKAIQWPAELIEGQDATWKAFSKMRGLTYPATYAMVKAGILRFQG
jgi:DNA primase